jgi:uncharacterized protein with von Willebrand factor type A (vWA) domain
MSQELVHGSIAAIAQSGRSIAEIFSKDVEAIVMVDTSASMDANDCQNGQKRHAVACDQLRRLQRENPAKVAVVDWASTAKFCPGGMVGPPTGWNTDIANALRFVHKADDTGIKLILISDGEPDSEQDALDVARTFKSKIDTIYIGPEGGPGAAFLRELAAVTGGKFEDKTARGIVELSQTVTKLLAS